MIGAALVAVGLTVVVAQGDGGPWWPTAALGVGSLVSGLAWVRYAAATPAPRPRAWALVGAAVMALGWVVLATVTFFAAAAVPVLLVSGGLVAGVGASTRAGRGHAMPLVVIISTMGAVGAGAAVGLGDDQTFRVVTGVAAVGLAVATISLAVAPSDGEARQSS